MISRWILLGGFVATLILLSFFTGSRNTPSKTIHRIDQQILRKDISHLVALGNALDKEDTEQLRKIQAELQMSDAIDSTRQKSGGDNEIAKVGTARGNLTVPGPNNLALPEGHPQPLHYDIIGVKQGAPLRLVKLKYLVACRKYHPECGGDPEMFLRASLAYQDVLKDYGIESIKGEVVNLGNFQSDTFATKNYLEAREQITEYIPLSTLDEHIHQLEQAQSKMSYDMEKRLTANDTDAMWLLEDVDEITEKTKSDTVTLRLSETGDVTAHSDQTLLASEEPKKAITDSSTPVTPTPPSPTSSPNHNYGAPLPSASASSQEKVNDKEDGLPKEDVPPKDVVETVTVTKGDILALNAKHMVQQREDIAGMAARTATTVMNNTVEARDVKDNYVLLFWMVLLLGVILYVALEAWSRAKMASARNPHVKSQLSSETMLPWWGNDSEYERQVKRIFIDEWRRARASARKTQIFQDGINRESLPTEVRERLDLSIFAVTADRLRQMKTHADSQPGKV